MNVEAILTWLKEPMNCAVVALCGAIALMIQQRQRRNQGLPLPPGPPGNWLLGNTLPKAL